MSISEREQHLRDAANMNARQFLARPDAISDLCARSPAMHEGSVRRETFAAKSAKACVLLPESDPGYQLVFSQAHGAARLAILHAVFEMSDKFPTLDARIKEHFGIEQAVRLPLSASQMAEQLTLDCETIAQEAV